LSYARLFNCECEYYPLFYSAPNATQLTVYVAFC